MIARLSALVLVLGPASIAAADVLGPPTRPQWDDTPIPMPADPTEVAIVVALFALVVVGLFLRARRVEA